MDNILDGSTKALKRVAWSPDGHVYDECDPYPNTKENRERFAKLMEEVKPKLDSNFPIGQVTIYGTAGNMEEVNFKDLFVSKCRAKHHNHRSFVIQPNINYKMKKIPKFKLLIERDSQGDLYAMTQSLNGNIIWRTSESYEHRRALVNACKYICKPSMIVIDLPNADWKYIEKLNLMLDEIWE